MRPLVPAIMKVSLRYVSTIRWEFVGDRNIGGKKAVREYLNETYMEPPKFNVKDLIARANL